MKNLFFFLLTLTIRPCFSFCQSLTGTADDKSSLQLGSSNISFNTDKGVLTFNFGNIDRLSERKVNNFFWQTKASGNNSEGITNLFQGGEFVPAGNLQITLGERLILNKLEKRAIHTFYDYDIKRNKYDKKSKLVLIRIITNTKANVANKGSLIRYIDKYKFYSKTLGTDTLTLKNDLNNACNSDSVLLSIVPKMVKSWQSIDHKEVDIANGIYVPVAISSRTVNSKRSNLYVFANGGINTLSSFKLYNASETTFSDRFISKNFTGGFAGIGANLVTGAYWIFGALIKYEHYNTFDSLASKTYTIQTTDVSASQQLTTKKDVTAYTGNYGTYNRLNIRADIIRFIPITEDYNTYISIGAYVQNYQSSNKNLVKGTLNVGLDLSFFKLGRKFLGGFYTELDNVRNINFQKNLTIGFLTKFTFDSIMIP